MNDPLKAPKPKLKPGIVYSGDNGQLVCLHCAGQSALYTGRDTSGRRVEAVPVSETVEWRREFGRDLACEAGCTVYLQPTDAPSRQ